MTSHTQAVELPAELIERVIARLSKAQIFDLSAELREATASIEAPTSEPVRGTSIDTPAFQHILGRYSMTGLPHLRDELVAHIKAWHASQSASVEDARDAAKYRWLRDSKFNALYLTRNEDHSTNYVTAKEWIERYSPESFARDDQDEVQAMKDSDTIWRVQIYPDTPIGSYSWHGATIDSALGAAIAAMTTKEPT